MLGWDSWLLAHLQPTLLLLLGGAVLWVLVLGLLKLVLSLVVGVVLRVQLPFDAILQGTRQKDLKNTKRSDCWMKFRFLWFNYAHDT